MTRGRVVYIRRKDTGEILQSDNEGAIYLCPLKPNTRHHKDNYVVVYLWDEAGRHIERDGCCLRTRGRSGEVIEPGNLLVKRHKTDPTKFDW